ncbi:hypothetical protein Dda_0396 [Drechslerella dactyloides]|uniref:Mitochondrial fission process protein 1 n=1 Tax=Drechslerella dactyloides TaxID=74499 RepID=A0AAD6J7S8_DREDA|nr:hypothetical protein Dda_0396 [Drechslerella dactyloides]
MATVKLLQRSRVHGYQFPVHGIHQPDQDDTSQRASLCCLHVRRPSIDQAVIPMADVSRVVRRSDIGESFRPVAHPWLVRSAYGVSWLYLTGDVGHEMYKAYLRNQEFLHKPPPNLRPNTPESFASGKPPGSPTEVPLKDDYRVIGVQRAIFQSVASMLFPAVTIHSIVKYSGRAMKDVKNVRLRTWGPIGLGLAVVPALPFIFDHPVEQAVEWGFDKAIDAYEHKRPSSKGEKEL